MKIREPFLSLGLTVRVNKPVRGVRPWLFFGEIAPTPQRRDGFRMTREQRSLTVARFCRSFRFVLC